MWQLQLKLTVTINRWKRGIYNGCYEEVPVREQAPDVRNKNFDEVCLGYNAEEAQEEATRCLNCKNARCVQGCPVSINIT